MDKKEMVDSMVENVISKLPKTTNAVDNVVSSIINIFDILITPFQVLKTYKDIKMEEFKSNLECKVNKIPKEYLKTEVDLNIVGPTLEALKYTFMEDELREMFENLLTSSIDKREDVFPSFIDIIRQLGSDEAKLLHYLSNNGKDYPLIDLHYKLNEEEGYYVIFANFTDIGYGVVEKPELVSAYLNNLERFGLIKIQSGIYLVDDSLYQNLENHSKIQQLKLVEQSEPGKYEIEKKKFSITDYGLAFIQACVVAK